MAGGAAFLGFHIKLLLEFQAEILGGFDAQLRVVGDVGLRVVVEVVHFFERAEVFLGSAVAIEAPAHRVALVLIDHFHFVHIAVAALAGNPAVYVGCVIEIDEIGGVKLRPWVTVTVVPPAVMVADPRFSVIKPEFRYVTDAPVNWHEPFKSWLLPNILPYDVPGAEETSRMLFPTPVALSHILL